MFFNSFLIFLTFLFIWKAQTIIPTHAQIIDNQIKLLKISVVNNELLAMNNPIKVRIIHMIRIQYQFLILSFFILKLSIINITHLIAKMIHIKTTNTNMIVSQVHGKHINNNQSKAERIEAIKTNALSSNAGFLIENAIHTIHKINDRIAKITTIVVKPKFGIVSKQHQKIR